jgi:hypothetical protein
MISDELRLDKLRRRQRGPPPSNSSTAVLQQFCSSFAAVCGALAVYLRSRQDECFSAPVFHRLLSAAEEPSIALWSEGARFGVCDAYGPRERQRGVWARRARVGEFSTVLGSIVGERGARWGGL